MTQKSQLSLRPWALATMFVGLWQLAFWSSASANEDILTGREIGFAVRVGSIPESEPIEERVEDYEGLNTGWNPQDVPPNTYEQEELQYKPEMFSTPSVPADVTDAPPMALRSFDYTPRMTRNFQAINQTNAGNPPDCHMAAGPNHIVIIVNGRIRAFRKNASAAADAVRNQNLSRFFCTDGASGCPNRPGPFDPKVIYDPDAQRFFAIALGRQMTCTFLSYYYIAASSSSDPTDPWNVYHVEIDRNGEWGDYPSLGMGNRAVYVSLNYLPGQCCCPGPCPPNTRVPCTGWTGSRTAFNALWVLDKTALVAGASSVSFVQFIDIRDEENDQFQTFRPTVTYGSPPAGFDAFLLAFNNISGTRKATVWGVTVPSTFPSSGTVTLTRRSAEIPTPPALVLAQQRGGPGLINTWNIGAPPYEAVYRNNRIWTSTHQGAGAMPERTALRYFEVNVASWPSISLESTGTFWDGTSFYYYPGLTTNQFGDMAMVFSRSRPAGAQDAGEFAGSRWTIRLKDETELVGSRGLALGEHYYGDQVNDQAGVCTAGTCTAGVNIGNSCTQNFNCTRTYRWGDYAGIAADPVGQGFWMFHEYSIESPVNPNQGIWAGQIGYIPRAVFVDGSYSGLVQTGSRPRPYKTIGLGHLAALVGNDLVIRTGNYPASPLTLDKAVTIIADGGPVIIGE